MMNSTMHLLFLNKAPEDERFKDKLKSLLLER